MDTIVHEENTRDLVAPTMGTLWKDRVNHRFYLLAQVGFKKYVLINLETGNYHTDPVHKDEIEKVFDSDHIETEFVPFEGTIELIQEL